MKQNNILFFSRRFYPHVGGVEKHIWEVGKELIKRKYLVTLVTEKSSPQEKDREIVGGIHIYRIDAGEDTWVKKFIIWRWLWKHSVILQKADIIHCHDVFYWYLPFSFFYPLKKFFITFHGYEGYPIPLKNILQRNIAAFLSDGTICIGEFMKKWYKTVPTVFAYGGVMVPKKKWKSVRSPSATFLGRLDEQTNIPIYVAAVDLIRKKIPSFRFLVVGDGPLRSSTEKQAKVIGFQKNGDVFLDHARFAFVSRNLSILEAMARKKLVFAVYDNPLKNDYLQMMAYAPYIVIVGSAVDLAKKVLYYTNHPKEEKELVRKAYNWVCKQTWNNMTETYLRLWQIDRSTYI